MLTIELYNNTSACMCEFTTTMCYLTLRNKPSIKIFTINWVIVQYVRNLYKFMKKLGLKKVIIQVGNFVHFSRGLRNNEYLPQCTVVSSPSPLSSLSSFSSSSSFISYYKTSPMLSTFTYMIFVTIKEVGKRKGNKSTR